MHEKNALNGKSQHFVVRRLNKKSVFTVGRNLFAHSGIFSEERTPMGEKMKVSIKDNVFGKIVRKVMIKNTDPLLKELEDASKNVKATQYTTLRRILEHGKDTSFGRDHKFIEILKAKDDEELYSLYTKNVPVSVYNDYDSYIEKSIHGEPNQLVPGKPELYLATSGTTGKPKYIPMTAEYLDYINEIQSMLLASYARQKKDIYCGKILALTGRAVEGHAPDGTVVASTSGATKRKTSKAALKLMAFPDIVMSIEDYNSRYYVAMRFAIEKDVRLVLNANPTTVLELLRNASKYYDDYCDDIEKGTISDKVEVKQEIREELLATLKPNKKRADELRALKKKAGRVPDPKDFWPNMRVNCSWKCGNTSFYNEKLDGLFPAGSLHQEFGYFASECRFGYTLDATDDSTVVYPHRVYLEFIPEEELDKKNPKVLRLNELEVGKRYSPLVTNPSGLYRYNMNDLVEVTGRFHESPRLLMIQKINGIVSLTGEKLYEKQFMNAVNEASSKFGKTIEFYMGCGDLETSAYHLFYEFKEKISDSELKEFNLFVDKKMQEYNMEYEAKRKSLRLNEPVPYLLPEKSFGMFKEALIKMGRSDGQFKITNLVQNDAQFKILKDIAKSCAR